MSRNNNSFTRNFVRGEIAFGTWNIVSKVLVAVNSFIVLSALTIFQFGLYQLIIALVGLAELLFLSGINGVVLNDLVRFNKEDKPENARKLLREFIAWRISIGVVLFAILVSGASLANVLYDKDIASFLRIAAALLLFDSLLSIFAVFLKSELKFNLLAAQSSAREVLKLGVLLFFLATSSIGIVEALWSQVISAGAWTIILGAFVLRDAKNYLKGPISARNIFWPIVKTYGKWAVAKSFVKDGVGRLQLWLIKIFISTEAVAIFSLALALADAAKSLVPGNVLASLIPREIKDPKNFSHIFLRGLKYFFIGGVVIAALAALAFPLVVNVLLPHYGAALPFFLALTVTIPLYATGKVIGTVLIAHRDQRFLFGRTVLSAFLLLVASPIIYNSFGLWGAVSIVILDYLITVMLFLPRARKIQPGIKLSAKEFLRFDSYDRTFLLGAWREIRGIIKSFGLRFV